MADSKRGVDSLSLDQVIKRFFDSEQTLSKTEERLRGLALAEEGASAATSALEAGAGSLTKLVAGVQELVAELRASQKSVLGSLEAAKKFLESTDLGQLKRQLKESIASTNQQLANISAQLDERLAGLEMRIGDVEQAKASAIEARQALAATLSKIPDKAKRKFGIG